MTLLYAVMKHNYYVAQKNGTSFSVLHPEKEVNPAYGFETPAPDNQWVNEHCGIRVYRTHVFFFGNYCVACFISHDETALNDGYEWITPEQLAAIDANEEILSALLLAQNGVHSKTVSWISAAGFSGYLEWAIATLAEQGYSLCGAIQQIKNAYVSSIFKLPTNKGMLYLKISASVYVNNTATEQIMTADMGGTPIFVAVSPDGLASITKEMSGEDCQSGSPAQYKNWLMEWGNRQVCTINSNIYSLTDCTPQKLLDEIPNFPNRIKKIYEIVGRPFDIQQYELLKSKLASVRAALTHLCAYPIPNAVCHADIRPGNVRITDSAEILYDWGMAFWGHPFYDAIHFLHVVRRQLSEQDRAEIINAYLSQWDAIADKQVLYDAYAAAEQCKDYFMLTADCRWVADILKVCGGIPQKGTMDNWLLSRRFYYFDRVLHRFIEE